MTVPKKSKFTLVTLVMVVFWVALLVGLTSLVITAESNKSEMVRDDYYEAGLGEDRLIHQAKLAIQQKFQVEVTNAATGLEFVGKVMDSAIRGPLVVQIYRPSDKSKDLNLMLQPDSTGRYRVAQKLEPGQWKLVFLYPVGKDSLRISRNYLQL